VNHAGLTAAVLSVLVASGCGRAEPRPVVLGQDACTYCRMTISDSRFGGEVITKTGRILTFDAVECLASWVRAADASTIAGVYTIDIQHPGTFVPAETAGFLRDALIKSPMGRSVVAFASAEAAEQQRAMLGGTAVTWRELVASMSVPEAAKP